ncbi:MAG: hypothetical protein WAV55_04000 [Clostridiaceae bacterium]
MKKIMATLLVVLLTLGFVNPVAAATKELSYKINTIEELKSSVAVAEKSNLDNEASRIYILKNTNPEVLETYTKAFFLEAAQAINKLSSEQTIINVNLPIDLKKDHISLPIGGSVEALMVDQIQQDTLSNLNSQINPLTRYSIVGTIFGDRQYTAAFDIYHFLYPDTRLRLVNRYSVSPKGLIMTSVSTAGTWSIFPVTVKVRSAEITDKYATAVGNDINGFAEFNVTIGGYNGIGLVSFNTAIISTMELIHLSSQSATIKQSRIVDHLGQIITD